MWITFNWNVVQKCIHGFLKSSEDIKGVQGIRVVKKVMDVFKKLRNRKGNTNTAIEQGIVFRRVQNVGIKHFPTNRIYLANQVYLDTDPCLLIIPILTAEEVINWNGCSYSAIVLAGPSKDTNKGATKASTVYADVGAGKGGYEGDFLATRGDLETARLLLERVVCCVSKSCKTNCNDKDLQAYVKQSTNTNLSDSYNRIAQATEISVPSAKVICRSVDAHAEKKAEAGSNTDMDEDADADKKPRAIDAGTDTDMDVDADAGKMPIAIDARMMERVAVRKILFSDRVSVTKSVTKSAPDSATKSATKPAPQLGTPSGNSLDATFGTDASEKCHPAPDPILLASKAASNWLKRHDWYLLPGCDSNDTDDDDSTIDVSFRQEAEIRGWNLEKKPLNISEITYNGVSAIDDDDPLTDCD
jgi:hypothetical protein